MIELDEKDAQWLDNLGNTIAQATKARNDFGQYLYFKYGAPEGAKLDLGKKAFIEAEKEPG